MPVHVVSGPGIAVEARVRSAVSMRGEARKFKALRSDRRHGAEACVKLL